MSNELDDLFSSVSHDDFHFHPSDEIIPAPSSSVLLELKALAREINARHINYGPGYKMHKNDWDSVFWVWARIPKMLKLIKEL